MATMDIFTYHSYCEAKYIVGFWMKISLIMLPEELDMFAIPMRGSRVCLEYTVQVDCIRVISNYKTINIDTTHNETRIQHCFNVRPTSGQTINQYSVSAQCLLLKRSSQYMGL